MKKLLLGIIITFCMTAVVGGIYVNHINEQCSVKLAEANAEYEKKISEYENEIEIYEKKISEYENDIEIYKNKIANLETQLDETNTALSELETETCKALNGEAYELKCEDEVGNRYYYKSNGKLFGTSCYKFLSSNN